MTGASWERCGNTDAPVTIPTAGHWGEVKLDPYLCWAVATDFCHFNLYPEKKISFLFELSDEGLAGINNDHYHKTILEAFYASVSLGLQAKNSKALRFFTGLIAFEQLDEQLKIPAVNRCFARIEMSLPIYMPGFGAEHCAWAVPPAPGDDGRSIHSHSK